MMLKTVIAFRPGGQAALSERRRHSPVADTAGGVCVPALPSSDSDFGGVASSLVAFISPAVKLDNRSFLTQKKHSTVSESESTRVSCCHSFVADVGCGVRAGFERRL